MPTTPPIVKHYLEKNLISSANINNIPLTETEMSVLHQLDEDEWQSIDFWLHNAIYKINNPRLLMSLEELLLIPLPERKSLVPLFTSGYRSFKLGMITMEQYINIVPEEREDIIWYFHQNCENAYKLNLINFNTYLNIPKSERYQLVTNLFSSNGIKAIEQNFISIAQYLSVPFFERFTINNLFNPYALQAHKIGFLSFENFIKIPIQQRHDIQQLFSDKYIKLLKANIFTLEEFCNIQPEHRLNFLNSIHDELNEFKKNIYCLSLPEQNQYLIKLNSDIQIKIASFTINPILISYPKSEEIATKMHVKFGLFASNNIDVANKNPVTKNSSNIDHNEYLHSVP